MYKSSSTSNCNQSPVGTNRRVAYRPIRCQVFLRYLETYAQVASYHTRSETSLYVLPNIRFRVDHAHVGLISTPVNQDAIVHLQKGVLSVVLKKSSDVVQCRMERLTCRNMLPCGGALCEGDCVELPVRC
jgi:hypothetical protein